MRALGGAIGGRGGRRPGAARIDPARPGAMGRDRPIVRGVGIRGRARMNGYTPLLAALLALLAGLAVGKAWERYKLRDGKWFDRRRSRQSPHYILGLNFLVANQIDQAIEELGRAAS